jgi:hypothetical protein
MTLSAIDLSESLAVRGSKKILQKKCPARNGVMHRSGPLGGIARNLGMTTT